MKLLFAIFGGLLTLGLVSVHSQMGGPLVGRWVAESAGNSGQPVPQPWGIDFAVERDDSKLVVRFSGDVLHTYDLDGVARVKRETKFGFDAETTTKASRSGQRVVIETQTGESSSIVTLTLNGDTLTITRELGGRGGRVILAVYKKPR